MSLAPKNNGGTAEMALLQQQNSTDSIRHHRHFPQMPSTSKMMRIEEYATANSSKHPHGVVVNKLNTADTLATDEGAEEQGTDQVQATIEFDGTSTTIESSPFMRSYNVSSDAFAPSKMSRLSLAIRRSLRLGPPRRVREAVADALKQKTTTTDTVIVQQQERQLPSFTEFIDLRPEIFVHPLYGTKEHLHNLLGPKHIRQLKCFLRENNWPTSHQIRKDLWRMLVAHGDKEFESSRRFYREQIGTLFRGKEPGIVVCDHGLKEVGVINLQRLLIVIEYAKPEIRFVPILYPLCAIFLHYHSVDDTFACVNRLLSQGNRFVLQSELAVFASRYTILALVKKFKKKIFNKLKRRLGTEEAKMADVLANWYFWIFKHLPLPYLVRVMDCFLVEGQKMLARAALTILYLWYKQQDIPSPPPQQQLPMGPPGPTVAGAANASLPNHITTTTNSPLGGRTTAGGGGGSANDEQQQQIVDISAEISAVASKVPISVQTFLDIGFSIRRFGNSFLYRKQRHYEAKFRNLVARQRAEKNARQVDERIYTPAFSSQIVDEEVARELIGALPARFQLETPTALFRLSEHGTSFVQFWSRLDEADQSLLIIRTTDNHIFGAYLSSTWAERKDVRERTKTRYFGTGESFVWRLDDELALPIFYTWCEQTCDNFFMTAGDKFMIIGSGGGDAIAIRDELVAGSSRPSTTFQSPELVPGGQFQIDELEAFGISSVN